MRNSHHPTPLCEIAFVSIFQKSCSQSLPKISVRKSQECEHCVKFPPPSPHVRNSHNTTPPVQNSYHPISATVGHISITSRSLFHEYYISFQILGSQESIASNGARFGVETKKLWQFEDDCAKLNGNVAAAPHFATVGVLSRAQIMHTICRFEA